MDKYVTCMCIYIYMIVIKEIYGHLFNFNGVRYPSYIQYIYIYIHNMYSGGGAL